jgi:ribosomal protein L10
VLYTYSNGVIKQTKTITISGILNSSTNLFLGSYNGGEYPQYFNGQIGVVRLYNKPLTAAEVLNNFNTTKGTYGL